MFFDHHYLDPELPKRDVRYYYFHTDPIGTPQEMTNAEGHVVWRAYYKAWGGLEALSPNLVEQNLRFQGQYHDRESGLYYNTFRYYDPAVGRFTTQDPIGLLGGDNLYRYAPNALGWIDPLGLACGLTTKQFKNKRKRIKNNTAAGGNRGIKGKVSPKDAKALGEDFVGPNHKTAKGYGSDLLISEDGLRQYRGPSPKRGVDRMSGEPWSKTGTQVNFQSRDIPEGVWGNNVHLDVEL